MRKTTAKIEVRGEKTILISRTWGGWKVETEVRPLTRDEAYHGANPEAVSMRMVAKNK